MVAHAIFNGSRWSELTIFDPTWRAETFPSTCSDVWVVVVALVLFVFLVMKIKEGGSETEPPYRVPADQGR